MKGHTIIIDTETTGLLEPDATLLENQPYITEIFCLKLNRKGIVVDEFETFINVPVKLEKHIIKITNITDSMLEGEPKFVQKYKELCDFFLGVNTMVAHNLPFDAGMLWVELSRIDKEFKFPWPPKWICTIEKSYHIENKRLKLSRLHEHATGKKEIAGAHRARTDVLALHRCYEWLKKEGLL